MKIIMIIIIIIISRWISFFFYLWIGQWCLGASRWLILVANRSLIFINALYLFAPYRDGRYYESSTLDLLNNFMNLFFFSFFVGRGGGGELLSIIYYIIIIIIQIYHKQFFFQAFGCRVRHATTISLDWIVLITIFLANCSSTTLILVVALGQDANKRAHVGFKLFWNLAKETVWGDNAENSIGMIFIVHGPATLSHVEINASGAALPIHTGRISFRLLRQRQVKV